MPGTLLFYIPSLHGNQIATPGYCEDHALGGSETAVVRLAASLEKLGFQIRIETQYEALPGAQCDVFIAVRDWRPLVTSAVSSRLRYYWAQDDTDQALIDPLRKNPGMAAELHRQCHGMAFVSHYQFTRWVAETGIPNILSPSAKSFLTSNGIEAETVLPAAEITPARPRRVYYASTPFRGLAKLVEAWPQIRRAVDDAELWIFGSRQVYGMEDWPEEKGWYDQARALPGVTCFGAVGQRALREAARQCRALAYPCTFPETSCIAAMEAMAAGCAVVSTHLGAMAETAWRNPLVVPEADWLSAWSFEVCRVLADDAYYCDMALQNVNTARSFGYGRLARQWQRRIAFDTATLGKI